ncbi:glycosyl transferase [Bordetella trematum]|uniref:Glycosyl transferase family protein n=1 Tax=Bordetella trematum TaxID=123899 RepID=A0A157QXB8_9BORD|nr:glycosyltransferase family A protein [Bordetella trematum]AUL48216.1 glycosyl transferase [Bordetella trematum]AZR95181.1 glycosyl transferase [Bordetella trematum]NNH18290.1 glycosyltransferase family 2 protein [Bordetella trematum]QIM70122.1 glycosyltransferase family 2 protein [Bordetella trematum]SAI50565.1 glycosyl transferase family protein [Bordetella trematum]
MNTANSSTARRFTVLTPTFNRADTLHRVYDSLCRQTCRDFEWLVVDDGSTDPTHERVRAWQAVADFPIRYVWQPNQHKKAAFNRGVRDAQGELIVALDSDDAMPADALALMEAAWLAIPEGQRAGFVAVTGLCARPDGSIVGDRYPQDVLDSSAVDMYFLYRVRGEKFGCMRTEVLRAFPFPEDVAGFVPESLVWWAVSRAGYRTRFINRVLRIYHDTPGSLMHGSPSLSANVQGLYLLAWNMLQHHLRYFRWRPWEFIKAAMRFTRFRLHLAHSGRPNALRAYRLSQPAAWLLVLLCAPAGYLLYLRDRRRGVA